MAEDEGGGMNYVSVPVDATDEMAAAGMNAYDYARLYAPPEMNRAALMKIVWSAMLTEAKSLDTSKKSDSKPLKD